MKKEEARAGQTSAVWALISLGANLGPRHRTLESAWRELGSSARIRTLAFSSFYETAPVGGPPQPNYLNAAGLLTTDLEPEELLDVLLETERRHGRVRLERWGPRTLDLDLLLYGDRIIRTERLTVPHPRFAERRFALEPAAQIAPNAVHPETGRTLLELLRRLKS